MSEREGADPTRPLGYGNPPRDTQFRPGQSGNLKGRPRGSENFDTLLQRMLAIPVSTRGPGTDEPSVAHYGKRHFWQLLRIGWLAPDIVSAIIDGRQPLGLTGRRLLRASNLPLDWAKQREFLGFA